MKTSDFYYNLPKELIAQDPLPNRDDSRLLILNSRTGDIKHEVFHNIVNYLDSGDCLVINDTKVIPARLVGKREGSGGKVELLLLRRVEGDVWEVLAKPGKKARPGVRLEFGDGALFADVEEIVDGGNRIVKFEYDGTFEEMLDRFGQMPLPPYITHELKDGSRYQTVYAKHEGSAAAPTAGLHFTDRLLDDIKKKGVKIAKVTLHVGLGTFRPVKEENVEDHHMHAEEYHITKEAADMINKAKSDGGRIICVGTTSCRTLEAASSGGGAVAAGDGDTDIFIYPGYRFKAVDGLVTNFHLPESTLLMLVSAMAGRDAVMRAYEEAVSLRYRFFSFGDAMFIF